MSAQPSEMMGASKIKRAIDGGRNQVFFEEGLGAIDKRLQEAEGADAAGSPAVLDAAHQLALEQNRVGDAHQHHHRDHGDFGKAPEKECENRHVRSAFFEVRVSKSASAKRAASRIAQSAADFCEFL